MIHGHHRSAGAARRGFTLIELILVMALLAALLTVSAPLLTRFFEGRRAEEEVRRLLALTRFARSEAISRAEPMELWIEPRDGVYGLRPQIVSETDENRELEYQLGEGLELEIEASQQDSRSQAFILFLPDGTIDEESAEAVIVRETSERGNGDELIVERSEVGMGYTIVDPEEVRR